MDSVSPVIKGPIRASTLKNLSLVLCCSGGHDEFWVWMGFVYLYKARSLPCRDTYRDMRSGLAPYACFFAIWFYSHGTYVIFCISCSYLIIDA